MMLVPGSSERMIKRVSADAIKCNCLPACEEEAYTAKVKKERLSKNSTSKLIIYAYHENIAGVKRIRSVALTWDYLLGT